MNRSLILIVLVVGLMSTACGASTPDTVGKDSAVVESDIQPTPTPWQLPTSIPSPTARPEEISSEQWQLLGLGPIKDASDRLHNDSEPTDYEEVVRLWDEFLSGTRMQGPAVGLNFDFAWCRDHSGRANLGDEANNDFSFTWGVRADAAGQWNNGIIEITMTDVHSGFFVVDGSVATTTLFITEMGVHYGDPTTAMTWTELQECPA